MEITSKKTRPSTGGKLLLRFDAPAKGGGEAFIMITNLR